MKMINANTYTNNILGCPISSKPNFQLLPDSYKVEKFILGEILFKDGKELGGFTKNNGATIAAIFIEVVRQSNNLNGN